MDSQTCKAGVVMTIPQTFKCACVTGVWGFYSKYCRAPFLISGGQDYCFQLGNPEGEKIIQVTPFGYFRYPLQPSLSHFREEFVIMTRAYVTDQDNLDLDASTSSFLTVTGKPWTLEGNTGEKLCLNSTDHTDENLFCLFSQRSSLKTIMQNWLDIDKLRPGCNSENVLNADACFEIFHNKNDAYICDENAPSPETSTVLDSTEATNTSTTEISTAQTTTDNINSTTETSTEFNETSPETTETSTDTSSSTIETSTEFNQTSTETTETTTETTEPTETSTETTEASTETIETPEPPITEVPEPTLPKTTKNPKELPCPAKLDRVIVKTHWDPARTLRVCSKSITDVSITDQLKRLAKNRVHKSLNTRQRSLAQIVELLKIHAQLMKITCPSDAVWPQFIDVITNSFEMLIRDDFFYGVEEFPESLFERINFSFKRCLSAATTFKFDYGTGRCNISVIMGHVLIAEESRRIHIDAKHRWDDYEPIIEASWKMFLNAHSYCYEYFFRLNDHHSYAVTIMKLFSESIYEKWIQPLLTFELYKFIVPNEHVMYEMMNNLEYCVGAVSFVSTCPVWLDRSSNRYSDDSLHVDIRKLKIKEKRSIWINHFQHNRGESDLWQGEGYCLRTAEDPSFYLGYGRCDHP